MNDPKRNPAAEQTPEGEDHDHPLGTLFILVIFLTVLAGMWGAMYVTLLNR